MNIIRGQLIMSYTIGDSYIIYDTIKGNYTLSDLLIPCRLVTS